MTTNQDTAPSGPGMGAQSLGPLQPRPPAAQNWNDPPAKDTDGRPGAPRRDPWYRNVDNHDSGSWRNFGDRSDRGGSRGGTRGGGHRRGAGGSGMGFRQGSERDISQRESAGERRAEGPVNQFTGPTLGDRAAAAFTAASTRGGRPGGFSSSGGRRDWFAQGGFSQQDEAGPVHDGTWGSRNGRRYYPEKETEVFKSVKDKSAGINFDSYDSIDVEVSGHQTTDMQPMVSFRSHPDMPPELQANILRVRYDKPTPVQKYAIPILTADRDLMACAQTGSGKTAAFLFPIIMKMIKKGPPPPAPVGAKRDQPRPVALVLSPTRELTVQIYEESRKFAFQTGIRTVVVYGGASISEQLWDLKKGCDICVATPGRLNDILERGCISLSEVKYLVLDEADRMLDMGFMPQIQQIVWSKDLPTSNDGRQTAMFSATFPREIQQLAHEFLRNYVYLTVGRVGSTNEFITQKLIYAEEHEKPRRLLQLLREAKGRVLVFVETKKKADVIEDYLCQEALRATSIHGDRTQAERSRALELFKTGACPILVATDVAARGLDIHSITWVINLDLPHNIEDYVHRIGRTGRAGNAGLATSFVNDSNQQIVRDLHRLLEEANQEVPSWFVDLTRACSHAARGFGHNRYGGGGSRRGNFGGTDMRHFDDHERRTFNAQQGSPRGGRGGKPMSSTGRLTGGSYGRPQYGRPQQQDDDDCW